MLLEFCAGRPAPPVAFRGTCCDVSGAICCPARKLLREFIGRKPPFGYEDDDDDAAADELFFPPAGGSSEPLPLSSRRRLSRSRCSLSMLLPVGEE